MDKNIYVHRQLGDPRVCSVGFSGAAARSKVWVLFFSRHSGDLDWRWKKLKNTNRFYYVDCLKIRFPNFILISGREPSERR